MAKKFLIARSAHCPDCAFKTKKATTELGFDRVVLEARNHAERFNHGVLLVSIERYYSTKIRENRVFPNLKEPKNDR